MTTTKRARRVLAAAALTAALAGVTSPAWAQTDATGYNGNLPRYQQSLYLNYQKKTTTAADAKVNVDAIGGDGYQVNLKVQNENGTEYSELKDNNARSAAYSIQDKTAAAKKSRLLLTNNTWTTVAVTVRGKWANK